MNLRQRRGVSSPTSSASTSSLDGSSEKSHKNGYNDDSVPSSTFPALGYSYWLHGICILLVVIGSFLCFRRLYTTEECDMTWSRRQFLHIEMPNTSYLYEHDDIIISPKYRLYKFFDQRDPRHAQFLKRSSTQSNDHCTRDSSHAVILYVPGHFGSFEQSRSIGAHGTQWTGKFGGTARDQNISQKLRNLHKYQNATTTSLVQLGDFFYDVYALDFREEGGAFHSKLVWRQAAFLARAVQYLTSACRYPAIIIFAHSMGGISTRIALQQYPDAMHVVQNVITVGTPHTAPVLTLEPGMLRWYFDSQKTPHSHENQTKSNNKVLFISISGGLRDEMIPPIRCGLTLDDNDGHLAWSILASDIMQPGVMEAQNYIPPMLGVDHRGIVWCYNLLSEIRKIIFALVTDTPNDPKHRLERVQQILQIDPSYDYWRAVENLRNNFKKRYGYFQSFVMETSLLYNLELLVKLHGYVGAFYYLYQHPIRHPILKAIPVMLAAFLQYESMKFADSAAASSTSFLSILVLAFVVDAIFVALRHASVTLARNVTSERMKSVVMRARTWTLRLTCVLTIGYVAVQIGFAPKMSFLRLQFSLAISLILGAIVTSLTLLIVIHDREILASHPRLVHFIVWSLVFMPLFFIGDLIIFFEGINHSPSLLTLGLTAAIIEAKTTIALRGVRISRTRRPDVRIFQFCRLAFFLSAIWRIFKIGPDRRDTTKFFPLHPLLLLVLVGGLIDVAELLI